MLRLYPTMEPKTQDPFSYLGHLQEKDGHPKISELQQGTQILASSSSRRAGLAPLPSSGAAERARLPLRRWPTPPPPAAELAAAALPPLRRRARRPRRRDLRPASFIWRSRAPLLARCRSAPPRRQSSPRTMAGLPCTGPRSCGGGRIRRRRALNPASSRPVRSTRGRAAPPLLPPPRVGPRRREGARAAVVAGAPGPARGRSDARAEAAAARRGAACAGRLVASRRWSCGATQSDARRSGSGSGRRCEQEDDRRRAPPPSSLFTGAPGLGFRPTAAAATRPPRLRAPTAEVPAERRAAEVPADRRRHGLASRWRGTQFCVAHRLRRKMRRLFGSSVGGGI